VFRRRPGDGTHHPFFLVDWLTQYPSQQQRYLFFTAA
jgi:hypothetical protein